MLDQSLATFRHALRDPSFGEKWTGKSRPNRFEHVFASIQSLNAANSEHLDPDHFDVVIVDEFHHAAAPSYQRLLDHVTPVELLGLTATPERSDGLPILHWFDDRIAAELRLWDAIDQHRLVPFVYFGIHDGLDLTRHPLAARPRLRRRRAQQPATRAPTPGPALVVKQVVDRVRRPGRDALPRVLREHRARAFMARSSTTHGIAAVAVWGDSPEAERHAALAGSTRPAGSRSCSPSTCSTRASTSRPSTPC